MRRRRTSGRHRRVTEGSFPVGVIQHAGIEAPLPQVTGLPVEPVTVNGILAVDVHHEPGDGLGAVADGDQMEVIPHERI